VAGIQGPLRERRDRRRGCEPIKLALPQKTALEYLKRIVWDDHGKFAICQDRFFAWADPKLIDQIERAKQQTPKRFENAPADLHPGATRSYKQIQFGEANVQLTFHENERLEVDGVSCVRVDVDYLKIQARTCCWKLQ
jgi:hypothetical protein